MKGGKHPNNNDYLEKMYLARQFSFIANTQYTHTHLYVYI